MKCEKCDKELAVGDWPFCKGDQNDHVSQAQFGYDPFTPYVDEHLGARPVELTTRGERQRLMRENQLEFRKKPKAKPLYFLT